MISSTIRSMEYDCQASQAQQLTFSFDSTGDKKIPMFVRRQKHLTFRHSFASITSQSASSLPTRTTLQQQSPLQLWLQDQLAKVPMLRPLVIQARAVQAAQVMQDDISSPVSASLDASVIKTAGSPRPQQGKGRKRCIVAPSDKLLWDMFVVRT